MISQRALEEFKEIWAKEIGTSISAPEMNKEALAVLTLFASIYRPITKEEYARFKTKDIGKPKDKMYRN